MDEYTTQRRIVMSKGFTTPKIGMAAPAALAAGLLAAGAASLGTPDPAPAAISGWTPLIVAIPGPGDTSSVLTGQSSVRSALSKAQQIPAAAIKNAQK